MTAWLATPAEAEHVTRLMVGFRDHLGRDAPPYDVWLDGVGRLLGDPATEFLLAGDTTRPGGVLQLRFRHGLWYGRPDAWIEDVFVEPGARGRGLGAALVDLAIERSRRRDCGRVQLDVNEENSTAWRLYVAKGFEIPEAGRRDVLARLRL